MKAKFYLSIIAALFLLAHVSLGKKEAKKGKKGQVQGGRSIGEDNETIQEAPKNETGPDDSLLLGTYRLSSDPKAKDFEEFLIAQEYSKSDREKIQSFVKTFVLSKDNKTGKYTRKLVSGEKSHQTTFTPGEEYEDQLIDGRKIKVIVTVAGNVVTRVEKFDGFDAILKMTFSKKGVDGDLSAKEAKAKIKYDRVLEKKGKPKDSGDDSGSNEGGLSLKLLKR